jgi:hypothetical protein
MNQPIMNQPIVNQPMVDVTSLNAIQSLFVEDSPKDPWARRLAGKLADLYVYGEKIRYAMAVHGADSGEVLERPRFLDHLQAYDSSAVTAVEYSAAEPRILSDVYLYECFDKFSVWAINNRATLKKWVELHHQKWLYPISISERAPVFSLEKLHDNAAVAKTAKIADVSLQDVYFAVDIILRYPLYGALAGADEWYLNHPIRDTMLLPTMTRTPATVPQVAISFADSISGFAEKLTMEAYVTLLHDLRTSVRGRGLHRSRPGAIEKEEIRAIAAEMRLPPRLSNLGKAFGIAGGLVGGLGAIPELGPGATLAAGVITVAGALWHGTLPGPISEVQWLRWALKWDIEDQAELRE